MNYKLEWGFGGLPQITMLICIDCVVYNQYIINDASPNITECNRGIVCGGGFCRWARLNLILFWRIIILRLRGVFFICIQAHQNGRGVTLTGLEGHICPSQQKTGRTYMSYNCDIIVASL